MTTPPGLTYRNDFAGPQDRAPVHALLHDTFGLDTSPLGELDLWDPSYRAFAYLDAAGTCAANAAAFALPLVVDGRRVDAAGIQSVATRPAWRGRGLSRALLARALAWCDARSPVAFLMTAIPGFYAPLGFRTLPQHAFVGDAPAVPPRPATARRLDLGAAADRRLLAGIARRRAPVSARFAVAGGAGAFVLNLLDGPGLRAWHMAAHDAVVVTAEGPPDGTLRLVDVAAPVVPRLPEILAALGARPRRVEVRFPPDRLGWTGAPIPADGATVLMARGASLPATPSMLPETAAF